MKNNLTGNVFAPSEIHGKSAYEIALMNGFEGSEKEWLRSLAEESNEFAKESAERARLEAESAESFKDLAMEYAKRSGDLANDADKYAYKAQVSAQTAEAKKTAAETAAERAESAQSATETLANEAFEYKQTAESKATEAEQSATSARTAMSTAQTAASEANIAKTAAESAEATARSYLTNASNAASTASEYASSASGSASKAKTEADRAETARTGAETARTEAETAKEAAETARAEAETAAQEAQTIADGIGIVQTMGGSETAVMSQKAVTDIVEQLSVCSTGKNLYNKEAKTDGYTLDVHGASVVSSSGTYSHSDYIAVEENTGYTFSHDGTAESGWITIVCFYDSTKTFVSYMSSPKVFTVPSGAAYLRFSTSTTRMDGNLQLEKGEAATVYEPYSFKIVPINQEEIQGVKDNTTETYSAYVSSGTFVSKADGKLYAGTAYGSTDYIPVNGGETIKIKGFYCSSNASVVAYNSAFALIGAIITDESDTGEGKVITLGDNAAYIRATSTATGSIVVEYITRPIAPRTTEDAPYSLGTLTANCFVSKSNGEILTNTTWYGVTDFIEVTARYLKIENPELSGNAGICEYDEHYNFISCVLAPEVTGGQYVVRLSANAKYIRATIVKGDNRSWLRLYPVSSMNEDTETEKIVDSWLVATGNQTRTPYKKINALSPTITFIDDDTMRYDAVKRYHDIFAAKGVKGCYGVITDYLDNDESLKNLLLEYEEEGFGMLFHAKWQDTFYMEGASRDIVEAEKDYCKGIRRMREIGFIDYNYWVSPYGVTDAEITAMCKRHGAKCLMSTSNNTFIQNNGLNGKGETVERYALPRCSMGYDDTQYPAFTLANLKAQIDKCVQTNGWLIVTTHVQQWADEYGTTPDERLGNLIQYAMEKGCAVKTFAEAYAERNGILLTNDIC